MGGAFARHLAAAGWRVIGHDIDPKACRAAARAGVEIAKSIHDLAAKAPTIITSLPHPSALHDTVAAIVAAKVKPRIVAEASTFTLEDKLSAEQTLRKAGHTMLDCPISGTGAQARVKDIVVYASGDPRAIRKLKPMFAAFSRGLHELGAFGNSSRMKYVANLLVAIHNVATAEAMVLGMKAGLDPKAILETIKTGAGNSRVFELRAPMMVKDNYDDATMKVKVWQKDMQVIGDFAKAIGCPTPLFTATESIYDTALNSGYAMQDTAAVCAVMEKAAGLKRRGKKNK
jgi:3-hydroxyisobutyrate dehydrogenase-like beta-hydroxyacid dehydrogenase